MPDDGIVGRLLGGRYRIDERLARGGMAHVYRARDTRLERDVAVKVLAPPYADDPAYAERFLAEARTAASFSHPNLAHVYDSGIDGDTRFIVMELLDRHRSLRDEIAASGPLAPADAVVVGRSLLAALAPLHEHDLVHCDVKSGNVLIGGDDVKLIDFGIARRQREPSAEPSSIGSLHAMSPEQLRGDALTPASDLFAVGVVLYEALTGEVPFPGGTPAEMVKLHAQGPPRSPSELAPAVGARLEAAVLQALNPEPRQRFMSAMAMDHALETAMEADQADAALDDGTTTIVPLHAAPQGGATARHAARRQVARPHRSALGGALTAVAGIGVLAMAGVFAVLLSGGLLSSNGGAGPGGNPSATASAEQSSERQSRPPGMVRVPNTIGMSESEAEAAAVDAGLTWRIEWQVDPEQRSGIYDQEPPAGRLVEAGSRFVMYSYRSQ